MSLEVRLLEPEDYRLAWAMQEWDCSYEHYVDCLNLPSYLNFAILAEDDMVGVISLERIAPTSMRLHVAKMRKSIHPYALATMLCGLGDYCFANGVQLIEAAISPSRRTASFLALRCGMREVGTEDGDRIFQITKEERERGRS